MIVFRHGALLELNLIVLEFDRLLLELLPADLVFVRRLVLEACIVLVLDHRRSDLVLVVLAVLLSILIRIVLRTVNLLVFILDRFVLSLLDLRHVVVLTRLIAGLLVLVRLLVQFRRLILIVFSMLIVLRMLLVLYLMRIVLEHLIRFVPLLLVFNRQHVFLAFPLLELHFVVLLVAGCRAGQWLSLIVPLNRIPETGPAGRRVNSRRRIGRVLRLIDRRRRHVSVCLSGVLDDGIVVPRRVSLILIGCLAAGDRLIRLLLIGILSLAQADKVLRVVVSTADQAQRLRHHRMNFRGGSLVDLRLDGETRRHTGHWFLMRLKVSVILSLSNRYRRAEVRRRRANIVLLLLNIPVLLLLLLLLRLRLLLLLMDPKILRQTIWTEIV